MRLEPTINNKRERVVCKRPFDLCNIAQHAARLGPSKMVVPASSSEQKFGQGLGYQ
jgi:hypothetical protein